ncbi:MAG: hypothetical protein KF819_18940 [Labilithrix sp.]|nr:hypothetical protein [Labilithrix sp.]
MDRQRLRFLIVAVTVTCAGCIGPPATTRESPRSLAAPPDRALVVVLSDREQAHWNSITRILDETAEIVADVPAGEDAVFLAKPGPHVYAAFMGQGQVPFDAACIGALRATLAPGRTYAFKVWEGGLRRAGKQRCVELELVAVRGKVTPRILAGVHPRVRQLLPAPARPSMAGDDLDVREAVVGLAQLRMAGDRPTVIPSLSELAQPPPYAPWSPDVSVLALDDGV